jgi:selenoprotein W-related protein
LEAELKSKFDDVNIKLISSGGGVFEVTLDGNLIFSKKALERFPNPNEIEELIEERR